MAISDAQREEIKARVDIADLVSSYGYQLKHSGTDLWCCCPFHTEKTPSFKVNSATGRYHCFGCGESGDVFDFVMKQEGLSFAEAIRKLAERAGVEIKEVVSEDTMRRRRLYSLMADLAIDFNKMLKSPKSNDAEVAREYLKSRNIDDATVDKFLIGYAPSDVDKILSWAKRHKFSKEDLAAAGIIKLSDSADRKPYFYFANRLVFTVKDKNGQVVAFSGRQLSEDKKSGKYINSPETMIFKKSRTFFAFDLARKSIVKSQNREAIICEGQIDCIRLHMHGYTNAVAPLGTAFTEDHAVMLHRVADTALLCFDDDGAGHKATIKAARLLLAEGMPIRVLALPDGDDPDSYVLKHGGEAFGKFKEANAESIVQFQIRAERAKETNPDDSNAKVRVTKAILETISKCRDKIHRDILLKEAAKRLDADLAVLTEEIASTVKAAEQENRETAEQLIDLPVAGKAEEDLNLPGTTEGAFISYLMENEDKEEEREEILANLEKLIPTRILYSPLTAKVMNAWKTGRSGENDAVRDLVEKMSESEYRFFISLMTTLDTSNQVSISHKNRIVYFARQLWHEYLVRLFRDNADNEARQKEIAKAITTLQTSTMKGVVHLILNFPYETFAKVA